MGRDTTKLIVTLFQMHSQGRFKVVGVKRIFYQYNITKAGECINKWQGTVFSYHVIKTHCIFEMVSDICQNDRKKYWLAIDSTLNHK